MNRISTTKKFIQQSNISKEINNLILPIIIENALQISSGLIATAMIGRLLSADISAQGACLRITDVLWYLFKGIGVGTTALIAMAHGAENHSKCKKYFEQSVITAVPLAILAQIILFFLSRPLLSMFVNDLNIIGKATQYMNIISCGFPAIAIMFFVTAAFHGQGNTKTPMYIAAMVNLLNLFIGFSLIFGKFGLTPLGLNGAAISMVISQYSGAIVGLILLYHYGPFNKHKNPGISSFSFKFSKEYIFDIYTTGLPAGMETIIWQISTIILSKIIFSYGSDYFSAYQLGIQAESFTEMPAIGFGIATTTLVAKAIGKKDKELFKEYIHQIQKSTLLISIVTTLTLTLLSDVFISILTDKPVLQEIGTVYVFIMGFIQIPQNFSRVYNGILRAAGYKNIPMYVAFTGIWLIRIPLALIIAYVLHWDIVFIWIAIAFDQLSKCLISYYLYRKNHIME